MWVLTNCLIQRNSSILQKEAKQGYAPNTLHSNMYSSTALGPRRQFYLGQAEKLVLSCNKSKTVNRK